MLVKTETLKTIKQTYFVSYFLKIGRSLLYILCLATKRVHKCCVWNFDSLSSKTTQQFWSKKSKIHSKENKSKEIYI